MDESGGGSYLPEVPGLSGLSVLARGGYSTVYRATQSSVGRDVAVKVEHRALETDHDRRRFLREARAAGRMSSHPHVVDLFDAGVTADGFPFLILELCVGSYADRVRQNGPMDPADVCQLGWKIADALADAHQLGVLHRDVKPANLLITGFGEPALADFGLAVLTEQRDVSMTLDVLTPAFAAKELFRHGIPPTPAVDVYALCATLYALMSGHPPRWADDRLPTLMTVLELFDRPIPDLPAVPDDFVDLLRAGMSNDPTLRPAAASLRDQLTRLPLAASVPSVDLYAMVSVEPKIGPAPQWSIGAQTVAQDAFDDEELTRMHPVVQLRTAGAPAVNPAGAELAAVPGGADADQPSGRRRWWRGN